METQERKKTEGGEENLEVGCGYGTNLATYGSAGRKTVGGRKEGRKGGYQKKGMKVGREKGRKEGRKEGRRENEGKGRSRYYRFFIFSTSPPDILIIIGQCPPFPGFAKRNVTAAPSRRKFEGDKGGRANDHHPSAHQIWRWGW
jgi:hypothetical protein